MCRLLLTLLVLSFLSGFTSLQAQEVDPLPKLYPAYAEDFSDLSSFPNICFEKAFMDEDGRMWLAPCGSAKMQASLYLFQLDGYNFKFVRGAIEKLSVDHVFIDFIDGHTLVGLTQQDETNQIFFYDLRTHDLRFEDLPIQEQIKYGILTSDKTIYLAYQAGTKIVVGEWRQGNYRELAQLDYYRKSNDFFPLFFNENELWFDNLGEKDYLVRYSFEINSIKKYNYPNFDNEPSAVKERYGFISPQPTYGRLDKVFFFQVKRGTGNRNYRILLKYNEDKDQIERVVEQPNVVDQSSCVFQDEVGNTLYVFSDVNKDYQAVLEDTEGKRYDYSAFFQALNRRTLISTSSQDFKKDLIICSTSGILIQQATNTAGIQQFLIGASIRAMIELPNHTFLVNWQGQDVFRLDPKTGTVETLKNFDCPYDLSKVFYVFYLDQEGKLFVNVDDGFVKFDLEKKTCETILTGIDRISTFITIDEDQLIFHSRTKGLFLFSLSTQTVTPILHNGQPILAKSNVNGMYYDQEKWLWVAANTGLWKIDPFGDEKEYLGKDAPFVDSRFLSMEPDDQGRLWLGTPLAGVNIYDPKTKELQIINNDDGLINNTVANILEDDDGDWWLGTYNGISIVDKEGQHIANLGLKDGLVEKEHNRFAALKAQNGNLLIGTINGLNVIDPTVLKNRLKSSKGLEIYLTSIQYYDAQKGEIVNETYKFNNLETLHLSASKRYLNLSFALSSIINPKENQYAYMLEGIDSDWTSLGNQQLLNLSNLPSGKYRLLIKGQDSSGNWTEEPIALSIQANEIFYKTVWFYVLLVFSAVLGALIWIRQLRSKVVEATSKIQRDKAIIESQAERLKENDQAKSLFFTNISHEFRTPLTIISGLTRKMKNKPEEREAENLNMVLRNSDHLLNLVNQILDLRKLEADKLEVNMIQADVIPYFHYLFESFNSLASSKGLQMHLLVEEEQLVMDYDQNKLLQVLSNLLTNSIKFTPSGGNIYFIVRREAPSSLVIQVKDTGIGISSEKLPFIFDRFYQVGEVTAVNEGTGIGLALSKELVSLLGGTLTVESEVNKGSTFTVTLPISNNAPLKEDAFNEISITKETLVNETELTTAIESLDNTPIVEDHPLILLVEDNKDVMQYLATSLEGQYNLLLAKDGQEGMEKAIEHIPDAIISDVMMPIMDGFELCDTLKKDERTSHIPIILLTAKADQESRLSGLRKGADDYLVKPFNEEELLTRLQNQLTIRRKLQIYFQQNTPQVAELPAEIQQEDEFLKKVREQLEANLDNENYGIAQICKDLNVSRTQLHRKIKALTGDSTSHHLRKIRLYKAKELLETTDLNISQVAYEVGFKYPNYFSSAYLEEFGVRPSKTAK
ncbi:MAG: ATP-binding protein [Bacteroidota bacterium]